MKLLIVGNDLIIQENYGALCKTSDEIEVDSKYLDNKHLYKFEMQFDNGEWIKVTNNKIKLDTLNLSNKYVIIRLKMINQATGDIKIVETDSLQISKYCYLGKPFEEVYPRIIANLMVEVKNLKERIRKLEEEGDLL